MSTLLNKAAFPVRLWPNAPGEKANEGMSMREYFAAHAPEEIPSWFTHVPPKKDIPEAAEWDKIENEEDKQLCQDWVFDGIFDLPEHLQWFSDTFKNHNEALIQWNKTNEGARYFQWRSFYADALIAELEKSSTP